jgi:hypothetical protein
VLVPTLHFTWLNEPMANRRLFYFSVSSTCFRKTPSLFGDPYLNHNLPADT